MNEALIRDAIEYIEQVRAKMEKDVEGYDSGKRHTGEFKNGRPLDTTEATVADLKRWIDKADALLAAFNAKS